MMRLPIAVILLICSLAVPASAQRPGASTVPVGTVRAERKPIAKTADFVGRVEAVDRVEVRARVTGYLEAVLFKEGGVVKEGMPLYRIEKGLFQADLDQAKGMLAAAKAKKMLTAIQLQRAEELMRKNAGTVVARDQALTADRTAAADIMIDQAKVDTAAINLGYTEITAPISGKIGRSSVTKGNVVGPQSGVLVTIVSQDPMYVVFPVSEREILRVRSGARAVDITGIKAKLRFADGSVYGPTGHIDFVGVTVNRTTDTVPVRAVFANPKGELIDGELATVTLEAGTPERRIVIPQAALISDQQGLYVFVVENGKAAVRRVKTGDAVGGDVIVTDGLSGGEQVVVQGLQMLRPGTAVQATPTPPALN